MPSGHFVLAFGSPLSSLSAIPLSRPAAGRFRRHRQSPRRADPVARTPGSPVIWWSEPKLENGDFLLQHGDSRLEPVSLFRHVTSNRGAFALCLFRPA